MHDILVVFIMLWVGKEHLDFSQMAIDVIDVGDTENYDYRLCLSAGTVNTTTDNKYLGVRSREPLEFKDGIEISFNMDWNNQRNGSYLTSGLYLCPVESSNPKSEDDWIKFEYVGVPPGKNIRINVWKSINGKIYPDLFCAVVYHFQGTIEVSFPYIPSVNHTDTVSLDTSHSI
ncbi:hypothetical protein ACFLYE_05080 [Chloroflexota bacterium]